MHAVRYGAQPDSGFGTALYSPKLSGIQDPFDWFIKDSGERIRLNTTTNDASGQSWETTENWPVGQWQTAAFTWRSGSHPDLYRGGRKLSRSFTSDTAPSGVLKPGGVLSINLGALRLNGAVAAAIICSKTLSDDQIAQYAQDFQSLLQLLAPQSIWVPVSAGGGPTPAGLATEADTSLALTARQIAATGTSTETDAAQALVAVQIAVTGRADETETALALTSVQITVAGLASETDAALALDAGAASAVGVALETDTALALDAVQITVTGIATEVDTALALTGLAGTAPGIASETDTAFALAAVQKLVAGAALEVDTALALSAPGGTLDLILKILVNRQELNPTTGTFTLYDDDGTTVLYTTNAWADAAGTAPYSGGALRRIDALF